MKGRILKAVLLLAAPLMLAAEVNAQDQPKTKTGKHEYKYKDADLKIKREHGKVKIKGETGSAYEERTTTTTTTENVNTTPVEQTDATVLQQDNSSSYEDMSAPVAKTNTTKHKSRKIAYAGHRKTYAKAKSNCTCQRVASRRRGTMHRSYAVHRRPRVIHDTVYVDRPVAATEYLHDTVTIARVDTVYKLHSEAYYSGYRRPAMNYKKLKVKKDGDEVIMKKKLENGTTIKRSFESEGEYDTYRTNEE